MVESMDFLAAAASISSVSFSVLGLGTECVVALKARGQVRMGWPMLLCGLAAMALWTIVGAVRRDIWIIAANTPGAALFFVLIARRTLGGKDRRRRISK